MTIPLLQNSHGIRPEVVLDDFFPEGIVAMDFADEASSLLIATRRGQLTLMKQDGTMLETSREFQTIHRLAWSDAGNYGLLVPREDQVVLVDRSLQPVWNVSITGRILAIAIAPHGGHLAFSTDSGRVHIVTVDRREIGRIDTPRPIDHLAFLSEEPALIAAAEFGSLSSYTLEGTELWSEKLINNVGDLSVSGCGRRILLAAFNHGIQLCNRSGKQRGSFMVDGIPARVSGATTRTRLAALTLENRVYWLDFEGDLKWAADLSPDPPQHICVGPLGDRLFLATASGRLMQLSWA
ncbi:MAG: hypothetical protein JNL58_30020 [Planctomyces sp.]|nr:hypothetical protein [Planctomyces sp.]